jgi:hypothetical protein
MQGIFLKLLLTVHIAGMATSVAGLYSSYSMFNRFTRFISNVRDMGYDDRDFLAFIRLFGGNRKVFWIGITMSLLSGALMMNIAYSAFMMQYWFIAKMILLIFIIVLFVCTRKNERDFNTILVLPYYESNVLTLTHRVRIAYALQFASFIIIFVLAVFRFN